MRYCVTNVTRLRRHGKIFSSKSDCEKSSPKHFAVDYDTLIEIAWGFMYIGILFVLIGGLMPIFFNGVFASVLIWVFYSALFPFGIGIGLLIAAEVLLALNLIPPH